MAFADGTISCDGGMMMLNVFPSPKNLEKIKAKEIESGKANKYDTTITWLQCGQWRLESITDGG